MHISIKRIVGAKKITLQKLINKRKGRFRNSSLMLIEKITNNIIIKSKRLNSNAFNFKQITAYKHKKAPQKNPS